jgi:hypothetical protein
MLLSSEISDVSAGNFPSIFMQYGKIVHPKGVELRLRLEGKIVALTMRVIVDAKSRLYSNNFIILKETFIANTLSAITR